MNPIQIYLRGLRIALSNWGLVWVCSGGTVLLLALAALGFVPIGMLWASETLQGGGWTLWAEVGLLLCLWLSLLIYGWFYLEGGLRGVVTRAHRSGPKEESSRFRLHPDSAFRVFTPGAFWEESKRNGLRVTAISMSYNRRSTSASVIVKNENGIAVSQASVAVNWTYPNGSTNQSGQTSKSGKVSFSLNVTTPGTYTITVTADPAQPRIFLQPLQSVSKATTIYYSGLVLADGSRPLSTPPQFSANRIRLTRGI